MAVWLFLPYANNRQIGAGDALWYANMLADFATQWRMGVFPVFVGQTDFAFNGAVYPLRVAPLYQHAGGLLDLITFHQLGRFALQHLVVIVCGAAAIAAAYLTLTRITNGQRWNAALLTILYISCPGVIGTLYIQDLYMTWMTVPILPLAVYGIIRTFRRDDLVSQVWLAAPLAGLWLAHAPVALWMTMFAAATQLVRLGIAFGAGERKKEKGAGIFGRAAFGAAIFILLGAYPFISVAALGTGESTVTASLADQGRITQVIHDVFPAVLKPLSNHATKLSDLQLGYGLWLVAMVATLAAIAGARRKEQGAGPDARRTSDIEPRTGKNWENNNHPEFSFQRFRDNSRDSRALPEESKIENRKSKIPLVLLLLFSLVLLMLLTPIPGVTDWLWEHLPETIKRITFYWPMHRFYLLLAAAISAAGGIAGLLVGPRGARAKVFTTLLALGAIWSVWESRQFVRAAHDRTATSEASIRVMLPENRLLMAHSYGLFSALPPHFSHGVMDPAAEFRLLPSSGHPIDDRESKLKNSLPLHGSVDVNPGILKLDPVFHVQPGKRYELRFEFRDLPYVGVLHLSGRSFFREYVLPASGESAAFGTGPKHSHALILSTSRTDGDDIEVRFIPTTSGAKPIDFAQFGRYRFAEIDSRQTPIHLSSLVPLRATVSSNEPADLETPRMYQPGYLAKIDGLATPARRSADGLVAVSVPSGTHEFELSFAGPRSLRLSYWLTLAAWLAVLVALSALRRTR